MDEELQQNIQINPEGVQEVENTIARMSDIIAEDQYQEDKRDVAAAQAQQELPSTDPRSRDEWGVKGLAKKVNLFYLVV